MHYREANLIYIHCLLHGDEDCDGRLETTGFPNQGITDKEKGQAEI